MTPSNTFRLPRIPVSEAISLCLVQLFFAGGTVMAAHNLIAEHFGWQNSALCLVWITGYLAVYAQHVIQIGGLVSATACALEHFAPERMVRVTSSPEGPLLWVGYRLWGVKIASLEVKASGLREITWMPGQASCMCNKDLNDWLLFLHLSSKEITRCRNHRYPSDGTEFYQLAYSLTREDAKLMAHSLAEFLAHNDMDALCKAPATDAIQRTHERRYKLAAD